MDPLLAFGFWAFVLTFAGIYAIFVLGLQLEVGDTGLINFGHVAFMAIGAYTMGLLVTNDVTIWVAIPLAVAAAAAGGLLLGLPTLRLRADYFAITTIAAGEILRITIQNEEGTTGGTQGLRSASGPWRDANNDILDFFSGIGVELDRRVPLLVLVWVTAVLVGLLLVYLGRTPWRRVLRAVRENEEAAAAAGKPVFSYKLQALALGSAIAGLAGVFYTLFSTTLFPDQLRADLHLRRLRHPDPRRHRELLRRGRGLDRDRLHRVGHPLPGLPARLRQGRRAALRGDRALHHGRSWPSGPRASSARRRSSISTPDGGPSSTSATCASASAACAPWTARPSRCARAASRRSSVPTAPARPPSSTSLTGFIKPEGGTVTLRRRGHQRADAPTRSPGGAWSARSSSRGSWRR